MTCLPKTKEFLMELSVDRYSEETLKGYKSILKQFADFLKEQKISFKDINNRIIDLFKKEMFDENLSARTINRRLVVLRVYFGFLRSWDYSMPVIRIRFIKEPKTIKILPTLNDIKRIIEAPTELEKSKMASLRNRALLEVLFASGCRISEALSIKWTDIEDTGRVLVRGKGKKERYIYLTQRAMEQLRNYKEYLENLTKKEIFLSLSSRNTLDNVMYKDMVNQFLWQYRKKLGISQSITAHTFRNCFATFMAEKGASLVGLNVLLGHIKFSTTAKYICVDENLARISHQKYHPLWGNFRRKVNEEKLAELEEQMMAMPSNKRF